MSINSNSTNLHLDTKRHSFAHLMAAAVGQMFPEAQYGVGPVIETGCYYDFVLPRNLIPEDLPLIENHIKDLLKRDLRFKVQELSLEEAISHFSNAKQPLKVELLENLRDRGTTSMSEEEKADFGMIQVSNDEGKITTKDYRNEIAMQVFNSEFNNFFSRDSIHLNLNTTQFKVIILNEKNKSYSINNDCPNINLIDLLNNSKYTDDDSVKFDLFATSIKKLLNLDGDLLLQYLSFNLTKEQNVFIFNFSGESNNFIFSQNVLDYIKTLQTKDNNLQVKSNISHPTITIYRIVDEKTGEVVFEDLCKGPHVAGVRRINNQNIEKAEVGNSPLEGWQAKPDGVDIGQQTTLPNWKTKSLFPFWNLPKNKELEAKAQELRQAGNLSEVIFWNAINNKTVTGYDIDRQAIIGNYIVDFFIPELGLVFEIDGQSHDFKGQYDAQREEFLVSLGLKVIHFADIEIKKAIDQVGQSSFGAIKAREKYLIENPAWTPPRQPAVATPQEGNYDAAKGQGISEKLKKNTLSEDFELPKQILVNDELVIIKLANIGDAKKMIELKREVFRSSYAKMLNISDQKVDEDFGQSAIDELINFMNQGEYVIAVNSKNEIVGMGAACADFEIRSLFVDENYQSKGIGTKILTELTKILINRNGKNPIISTLDKNQKAIDLYTRFGFEEFERINHIIMGDFVVQNVKMRLNPAWTPPRQPAVATPQEGNYDAAKGQIVSAELKQTIDTYNNHLDKYIAKTNPVVDGILKQWIDLTLSKINKDSVILEIGSETGKDADYIESNGFKVDRTDYTQSFVEYQKSLGKEISQYNVLNKPAKKQYDLVFANAVLLHFNDQEFSDALTNVNQSLNDNGLFAFSVKQGEVSKMVTDSMQTPRFFRFWQNQELQNVLINKGFEVVEILEGDNWLMVVAKKVKSLAAPETLNLQNMGFKLDKFSASYWRGDQARGINMQRLYALFFETKDKLKEYINQREEAKKRDHRVLGEQLNLFSFSELVGKGLPLWLPKGRQIQILLEKWAEQEEKKQGYSPVATPLITKENLFYTSGHLPHYKDSMYAAMEVEGENYYIKPMNCPFHHQIFAAKPRSYKELPLRFSEYGFCHRYEDSGSLFGLMRVRGMKMNDAHIYCTREQAVDEFVKSVELIKTYFGVLGITDYWLELALRNPENDKYHNDEEMWNVAEDMSKKALEKANVPYIIEKDGAAFYGPKIDIQVKSITGKVFTASTSQIDLYMPQRFELNYINEKSEKETPVVIHRAPLSTHERMIGFLIEHFAGRFPFWLAPEQIRILTINDEVLPFVEKIKAELDQVVLMHPLKYNEVRYSVDDRMESLGKKIRDSKLDKVPMFIVVGMKDVEEGIVSIEYAGESIKVKLEELKGWVEGVK
jgi:threonyl-tRNA synthetase